MPSDKWKSLAIFDLSTDWQIAPLPCGHLFRLRHVYQNHNKYQPVGAIALASQGEVGLEIYSPQKIYPKQELEIIAFPIPPNGWDYGLAVKQLVFANSLPIQWRLLIDMPLFNPAYPAVQTSSNATVTAVAVSTSNVVILAANLNRTGATVTNTSKTASLFLELGSPASLTSYSVKILPGGYDEIPFNFTGVLNGVWDKADTSGNAVTHEFSV